MKTCTKCGEVKALTDFVKAPTATGRGSQCRKCHNEKVRENKAARMVPHKCESCGFSRLVDRRSIRDGLVCGRCQRRNASLASIDPNIDERNARTRVRKYSRDFVRDMTRVHKRVVRELQWIEVRKPRICENCEGSFVTESWTKIYCSEMCAKRAMRGRSRDKRGRFWVSDARRRSIYERDGWLCFCGDPVIPWGSTDAVIDDRWATLDHIQPRSLGGSDDESNLRTAHFGCNSERGADPDWELELSVA